MTLLSPSNTCNSVRDAFDLWSRTYDDDPNPLLTLEARLLRPLLQNVEGQRVIDVGCGTGRCLQALSKGKAELVGVDSSPDMLARAHVKCGHNSTLLLGEATALPVASSEFNVVLASFVLSYVDDLELFVREVRRITRPGARVFITDLHPETATALQWKRAFRSGESSFEIKSHHRSIREITDCFARYGFEFACLLEPNFGAPELEILRNAAKLDLASLAAEYPPIFILQMNKRENSMRSLAPTNDLLLARAQVALGPEECATSDVLIANGNVRSLSTRLNTPASRTVDLEGYLLLPGLINAHDHLEFGLFPNLGHGPYSNCVEWAADIHCRESYVIEQQRKIPKDVRIWWGAIRNLLCGVTTVCHHNPLAPEMDSPDFPVRVLQKFGWAHSIALDADLQSKLSATSRDLPFIIHACEGVGKVCAREIFQLDVMNALNERTVIVHGLALNKEGMALLNKRGAAVVWCPSSNCFLFQRTHSAKFVSAPRSVVLGSDSPLTAVGDLLDEIRFAHTQVGITPQELYPQVTTRSARVFRMQHGEGTLLPGARADLIAVPNRHQSPAEALSQLSYQDVELVLLAGRVQLASEAMLGRLPQCLTSELRPLQIEDTIRWIRAPLGRIFGAAESVLGRNLKLGGKRVRNVTTEWM